MYLDTIVAVHIKDNMYRYGFIGTFDSLVFYSEPLCRYYKKRSIKNYCKLLYDGILSLKENEVTLDILEKAPCNNVTVVNKNGEHLLLKTKPVKESDAEEYIQREMKLIKRL